MAGLGPENPCSQARVQCGDFQGCFLPTAELWGWRAEEKQPSSDHANPYLVFTVSPGWEGLTVFTGENIEAQRDHTAE